MKKIRIIIACVFVLIFGVIAMLFGHRDRLRSALYLAGCDVTPKAQSSFPGIGNFKIVHLACDHGEKEDYIDVYVYDGSVKHRWEDQGTLLLRYDPSPLAAQLPSIQASRKTGIVISVPAVSSVAIKVDKWNGMDVRDEIGHTDYP